MRQGIVGRKLGMTQVFDEEGRRLAVTVVGADPCTVVQRKTVEHDGYDAIQVGSGNQKEHRLSKAMAGHLKKANAGPCRTLCEFRVDNGEEWKAGDTLGVGIFEGVEYVDVTGVTKGRGFQGVVKRHRMSGGPKTHGGHSKRRVGAIGQCAYPARVAKGTRMPGHMGHVTVTVQNLKVVGIREEDNVLLIQGAVPGPTGGMVIIRKAVKKPGTGK